MRSAASWRLEGSRGIAGAARGLRTAMGALLVPVLAAACGGGVTGGVPRGSDPPPCPSAQTIVVAAESFWGSIAAQIGGDRVCVRSIIVSPDTDPHAYEARPSDARLIASAKYVVLNGAGYDPWVQRLLAASPARDRRVLNVGELVGRRDGDNPHMWYSPAYVLQVVERIGADLDALVPGEAAYFDRQRAEYRTTALREYLEMVALVKQRYQGSPVGATESIFVYLSDALGLKLLTPPEYMKAISEGTDPSAADRATVERQVSSNAIRLLVFNSQNSTRDVVALVNRAKARKIPVAEVTETLTPAGATFQDWQTRQLKVILSALGG